MCRRPTLFQSERKFLSSVSSEAVKCLSTVESSSFKNGKSSSRTSGMPVNVYRGFEVCLIVVPRACSIYSAVLELFYVRYLHHYACTWIGNRNFCIEIHTHTAFVCHNSLWSNGLIVVYGTSCVSHRDKRLFRVRFGKCFCVFSSHGASIQLVSVCPFNRSTVLCN